MPTRSVREEVPHTPRPVQEHYWARPKTGNPFFVFSFFQMYYFFCSFF
jgi:hypothetical protein